MNAFEIAAAVAAWWGAGFVSLLAGQMVMGWFDHRPGQIVVYPRDLILAAFIGMMGPVLVAMPPALALFVIGERAADRIIGKGDSGASIRLWPRAGKGG